MTQLLYEEHFWGDSQQGYDVLSRKMKAGYKTTAELIRFYRERIQAEENFGKAMQKSVLTPFPNETGTMRHTLGALSDFAERLSKVHMDLALRTTDSCLNPFKDLYTTQRNIRKTHDKEMERCTKALASEMAMVDKLQQIYENKHQAALVAIEKAAHSTGVGHGGLPAKEIEKLEEKATAARRAEEKAEYDYKLAVDKWNRSRDRWEVVMVDACRSFQRIEHERLEKTKTILSQAFEDHLKLLVEETRKIYEDAIHATSVLEPTGDMEAFIRAYGTGNLPPPRLAFHSLSSLGPHGSINPSAKFQTLSRLDSFGSMSDSEHRDHGAAVIEPDEQSAARRFFSGTMNLRKSLAVNTNSGHRPSLYSVFGVPRDGPQMSNSPRHSLGGSLAPVSGTALAAEATSVTQSAAGSISIASPPVTDFSEPVRSPTTQSAAESAKKSRDETQNTNEGAKLASEKALLALASSVLAIPEVVVPNPSAETKTVIVESKSVEPKSAPVESKVAITEPKNVPVESQPVIPESKAIVIEAKSTPVDSKSSPVPTPTSVESPSSTPKESSSPAASPRKAVFFGETVTLKKYSRRTVRMEGWLDVTLPSALSSSVAGPAKLWCAVEGGYFSLFEDPHDNLKAPPLNRPRHTFALNGSRITENSPSTPSFKLILRDGRELGLTAPSAENATEWTDKIQARGIHTGTVSGAL